MHGSAEISPWFGDVGTWGTWTVTYRTGESVLSTGARIRVQLPDSWHTGPRNGAKGVQSEDPIAANYVTARTAAKAALACRVEGGTTDAIVKSNRVAIDGTRNRYVYVVEVTVSSGSIGPDDSIEVVFGDTAGGSWGFEAGLHPQGRERVTIAVTNADHEDALLPREVSPMLELRHGDPVELVVVAPSTLGVGEESELRIALVDRYGNPATSDVGQVHAFVIEQAVELPIRWTNLERGRCLIPFTPRSPGVVRINIRSTSGFTALSNPIEVSTEPPLERLFWGDLHAHAGLSFDGLGRRPAEYARDVAALDFYSRTEHCEFWSADEWNELRTEARDLDEPGRFVPILGYEATFGEPWGHHNVFFRGLDGVVLGSHTGTLEDLWDALEEGTAFTIPHHTGIRFDPIAPGNVPGTQTPNPDWSHHDAGLRPLIEIYSLHGQCEEYDIGHPLAYEACDFTLSSSNQGPFYARDAWGRGLRLGVIAASDNHRAQPGRGEGGLAAVWASSLDRETLFDALRSRQTYATSGSRLILHFLVDDQCPGSIVAPAPTHTMAVRIHGTGPIALVELIRGDTTSGAFDVCHTWAPGTLDFEAQWVDDDPPKGALYYVRVRGVDRYRGRAVMAWSSPVWCAASGEAATDQAPVRAGGV